MPQKYREEIFNASECDSTLNERQWQIVRAIEKALAEGVDSGRLVQLKDKTAIPSEVQRQYVENYRRLIAELE